MKQCLKIILLLVIIFARVVAVFSQEQEEDYIPLFNKDGNQKWVWEVHGPPNSREELYNKAVLSEDSDTIINNIAYKKVYRYLYFTSYRKGDVDTTFTSYVREDNKKVYILIDEENIKGEELLYDFSLSVGDTFRLKYNEDFRYSLLSGFATNYFEDVPYPVGTYNSNLLTVIKIDTVNIGGIDRRRWHIENTKTTVEPYVIDTWIEGIGSRQGLFSDMIVLKYWRTGFYSSVRCYEYNNNLMIHRSGYIQGWQMDCDVPYSYAYYSLEEEIDKDISIYPNPVKDKLTIDSEKIFERVEIRNLYGQVVYAEQGTLKNIKINTAKMQSGIYMVRLISEDSIFNKKIIIK